MHSLMDEKAMEQIGSRFTALEARVKSLEEENEGLRTEVQDLRQEFSGAWTYLHSELSVKDPKPLATLIRDVLFYMQLSGGAESTRSRRGGGVAWHRNASSPLASLPDVALLQIASFLSAEHDGSRFACTAAVFAWPQPNLPKARSIKSYASPTVPKPVLMAHALGEFRESINGTFFPTGTQYNSRPLYRKHEDPNLWLRYISKRWVVSGTDNTEAHDDAGLCSSKEEGLLDPVEVSTWLESNGTAFVEQRSVTAVRHCLPVIISGALGEHAAKINGIYKAIDASYENGKVLFAAECQPGKSLRVALRYNKTGKWEVSQPIPEACQLCAYGCKTLAVSQQTNLDDPASAISWQVLDLANTMTLQRSLTIERHVIPPPPVLPLEISGIVGPNADLLNGTYEAVPSVSHNGKALLRNRAQPDIWLRYVTHHRANVWALSRTYDKDKNSTDGLASCTEKYLNDPAQSSMPWQVYSHEGLELLSSVLITRV